MYARMRGLRSVNYTVTSYIWLSYADAGRCNVCGIKLPFVYSLNLIMLRKSVHTANNVGLTQPIFLLFPRLHFRR